MIVLKPQIKDLTNALDEWDNFQATFRKHRNIYAIQTFMIKSSLSFSITCDIQNKTVLLNLQYQNTTGEFLTYFYYDQ